MMRKLESLIELAFTIIKMCDEVQINHFEKCNQRYIKSDNSIVTEVDKILSERIIKMIKQKFELDSIVCEESGSINGSSEYRWIIDPLDGTKNYSIGNPIFGTSIAIQHKEEIVFGIISIPMLQKVYYATRHGGAFCNGKKINVNHVDNFNEALLICDFEQNYEMKNRTEIVKKIIENVNQIRAFGSAIYNNLLIAEGKAEINVEFSSKIWDHAAALLILQEAGGRATNFIGEEICLNTKSYIASNGKIHEKVLEIMSIKNN